MASAKTIFLYSEIAPGDGEQFVNQLRDAGNVIVRINSPGGDVREGLAIFQALRGHASNVTTMIDGFALSMASVIAMAGQRVIIAESGVIMIHEPWTMGVSGNAEEMTRIAAELDTIAQSLVTAYASRANVSSEELRSMMRAETWLTAAEALRLGFVDEVVDALPMAARFDLSPFKNVPEKVKLKMNTPDPSAVATAAAAAEAQARAKLIERNGLIRQSFAGFRMRNGISELESQCLADPTLTIEDARAQLLRKLGEGAEPLGGDSFPAHVVSAGGNRENFLAAASDALLLRAGLRPKDVHPGARDLQGMSVVGMAEVIVSQAGLRRGRNPVETIKAAHGTSDFPLLLANTANKALMNGYENEPASHRMWVRQVDVADFKEQSRVARSEAPELLEVLEQAEFTQGSFGERREVYQLTTWGRIFSISRQAMINDDLGAFTDLPQAFGAAAARLEADKVYEILTGNPNMGDNVALFDAAHGNLGDAANLSLTALGIARASMRKQKGIQQLGYLNIVPRYLIVPAAMETDAESFLASITRPDANASGVSNPEWVRSLTLVVDPRLDDASETTWYLAAATTQADTVEVAYLSGQRGVFVEEEKDFTTDALKIKARLDFKAKAIDWRGLFKTPGTA